MAEREFAVKGRSQRLVQTPFLVPPFNEHYEGAYDARTLQWRRLGAAVKANNIAHALGELTPQSVLEVGCGTGVVIAEVARLGIGQKHVGVDLADPDSHRDAEASAIDLQQSNGDRLPYDDNEFDLVFASHVVEHVLEPRTFLAEVSRVTNRWVYLEVPCELHVRTKISALQKSLDIGHINAYTPESFRLLVESTGLKVISQFVFDHSLAMHAFGTSTTRAYLKLALRRGLLRLSPNFASRVFTYHSGILAEKTP